MMQPFFEGLTLGLLLSFLIGPVFFTLIKTSLEYGTGKGISVAFFDAACLNHWTEYLNLKRILFRTD
jgi:threonine/homoserine/homoserine lactone efflux protein